MSSKPDSSLKDYLNSLLTSFKEALDKFNHQENCFKSALDEIPLLKLDISQSIKREEEIRKQILQARQEFRCYWKKLKEDVDMLRKFVNNSNHNG